MKSPRKTYYQLYDCFALIQRKHDPCGFIQDKCIRGNHNGCCNKCAANSFAGCTVQALRCKAFLCETAFYRLPKRAQNRWRLLTEIMDMQFANLRNKETFTDINQQIKALGGHCKTLNFMSKIYLEQTVFPSIEKTICVAGDDIYGGAHKYSFINSKGFKDGKAEYADEEAETQTIQFVEKKDDGSMIPGVQSEQLVIALIDRTNKLNARFPSPQNEKMIAGLNMFLEACKERIEDRINRGVMGDLKK